MKKCQIEYFKEKNIMINYLFFSIMIFMNIIIVTLEKEIFTTYIYHLSELYVIYFIINCNHLILYIHTHIHTSFIKNKRCN